MNICLFADSTIQPHRGGVADYIYWAAAALTGRGHHVLCISISAEPCAPDVAGTLEVLDAHSPDLCERVASLLRQHEIAVLWMQTLHPGHVRLCREACDASGAKLVCHLHLNPSSSFQGYADCLAGDWYDFCRGRRRWAFIMALLRYPWGYLKRCFAERRRFCTLYRQVDALVLLSERFRNEFCSLTALKDVSKLCAVSNPLLLEPCNPLPEKQKEVLYVGRLPWQHKRVDRLLRAWHRVEKEFPEWKLRIVGDGYARTQYEELAHELGLARVYFEGKQDPTRYYAAARIFCMTSSFEGFGLVLIEAQAAGCVPVAFDSYASVHDIIEDGVNGCLVKAFDIKAYAETLRRLMSDDTKRDAMAEAARKSVERFDSDAVITRVEAMLEKVQQRPC